MFHIGIIIYYVVFCDWVLLLRVIFSVFIDIERVSVFHAFYSWMIFLHIYTLQVTQWQRICQCRNHRRCRSDTWVEKIPWRRKCNPLQYSSLENSMERGVLQPAIQGFAKSRTWLSNWAHTWICHFCKINVLSLVNEHLGGFQLWGVSHITSIIICINVFVRTYFISSGNRVL